MVALLSNALTNGVEVAGRPRLRQMVAAQVAVAHLVPTSDQSQILSPGHAPQVAEGGVRVGVTALLESHSCNAPRNP